MALLPTRLRCLIRLLARAAALMLLMMPFAARAVQPDEILPDPALEHRARTISAELRCLVCQNQSIDDSNAPLARDLRLLVRERLKAGDSDRDVFRYVVDRYGEFVLLRPPLSWHTVVLWGAPPVLLIGALLGIWLYRRRSEAEDPTQQSLSPEEKARLDAVLSAEARATQKSS